MWMSFVTSIILLVQLAMPLRPANLHIQLLGFNDFHGQLAAHSQLHGQHTGGAAYLAAYIQLYREKHPHTLLVHAGDMVGGSPPYSALLQDEPIIELMNQLRFDVGTLGNHEFDKGVTELKRLVDGGYHEQTGDFEGASFPYICANVVETSSGKLLLPPYLIKEIEGIPIAFIGVVTTETPSLTLSDNVTGLTFLDEAETVNYYTSLLKKAGIQTIIVLAHNPGKTTGPITTGELAHIAEQVDEEVDIIFGGHNHAYVNGVVYDKLLVQAYSYGMAFSAVNITIDRTTKDVIEKDASIVAVEQKVDPDSTIQQWLEKIKRKTNAITEKQIATIPVTLTRNQDKNGQSPLGSFIAHAQRFATGADIAFVNTGSIRADLLSGPVTWGTLFTIQPFNNSLITMKMTGAHIRTVLEEQLSHGTNMLQLAGIGYTWDQMQTGTPHVQTMWLESGEVVQDDSFYTVVTNAFLASGGDHFPSFLQGIQRKEHVKDVEALIQYVQYSFVNNL